MPIAPPPQGLFSGDFKKTEADLAKILDPITTAATEISDSKLAQWLIPERYKSMLDELVRLLQGADKLLHENPA